MSVPADNPAPGGLPKPKAAVSSRSYHRDRSHESAHAEEHGGDGKVIDHPLICGKPAEMVTTASQLSDLLAALKRAGSFAFDTEFIGEQSYFPYLCLIQVAIPDRVALIDPLPEGGKPALDVTPFWELICDPTVEKIVHAGQQDLEPPHRLLGKTAANVLDAQVAAGFVSLPYPLSLSKLIGELVGVRLGKGLTFTSWDRRPLSNQQARYAADDVRYLPAARQELRQRLTAAGHEKWAVEESADLCRRAVSRFEPDESFLKVRGASTLEPSNLAVMRELCIWRDAAARQADAPPRSFLQDEILLALARSPVKSVDKLSRVRGLPRPVETEHGATIVEVTLKGLARPASELAQFLHVEPAPREKFRCDSLWAAAQSWCFQSGIDPALVGSRQDIGDLWKRARSGSNVDGLRLMRGWRRELVGAKLLEQIMQPGDSAGGPRSHNAH